MKLTQVRTCALAACLLWGMDAKSQATIVQVRVLSAEVTQNEDCDGFLSGDSDFVFEFSATGNSVGLTNNNPTTCAGVGQGTNTIHRNGNNGPWTVNTPSGDADPSDGLFFNHDAICPPTSVNIYWTGYENDNACDFDLGGLLQEGTVSETFAVPVPAAPGTSGPITRTLSSGGCVQTYRITFEVTSQVSATVLPFLEDDICSATLMPLNTNQIFGWCPGATLEVNEPHHNDVTNQGSRWFYFIAPASGEVDLSTDFGGTQFGTYFELYHATDGAGCVEGIQPISLVQIKDKFDYLSHVEFSDGIDLLGLDPEAELTFDACDPVPLLTYQKLLAGEVYYVQVTADDPNIGGRIEIRVSDLGGGSPPDVEDIPCTSPTTGFGTAEISSVGGDPATYTLSFGCAFDGGNDHAETGAPHASNNPYDYHAYDYDHVAAGNGTMNESVWLNFVAPNQGRIVFETDYQSAIFSEDAAFFGYDKRFAPGVPADFSCVDLENLDAAEGGLNGLLGGAAESAIISQRCLEPGYTYYGMVDPANGLTVLNSQFIDTWIYDPSVVDPALNPPGNDILCLTMLDPLYEVPVTPAGITPPFQAVAGDNEWACREYLAGEPPAHVNAADRADQTVWHYFTVPPSGAIEMNIRAYIGLDTLRYAMYELLNGTNCYGGLGPATFTDDGTQLTPIITPILTGSAGFDGTQEAVCCMNPGAVIAIQLDGSYPGDEGQYIIEYIQEVESYAGDTYAALASGDTIPHTSTDTAFVCWNDTLMAGNLLDGIGQPTLDIPSCLDPGFVLHSTLPIPDPVSGSGITFIDTAQALNGIFINNTDGTGSMNNPLFNTVYYLSSMADDPSAWSDFNCTSSTVDNYLEVVYLQPVVPVTSYDPALCEITFTATGGMSAFNGSDFNYTIQDGTMTVVQTGTFAAGVNVVYTIATADVHTITIDDGNCPYVFTVDASACANPCIFNPIVSYPLVDICEGDSIFLAGAFQTTPGTYTDVFVATNGCDSTIYTTLGILPTVTITNNATICQGGFVTVGTSTYTNPGQYMDTLVSANGCDSVIVTNVFVESEFNTSIAQTICTGQTYTFDGMALNTTGVYVDTMTAIGGCDSIITLLLTVTPTITNDITQTICQGQFVTHGTQTLSTSGSYPEMFMTSEGCDSLVTLHLFVQPTIQNSITANICDGQSYTLGTQTLNTTGTYSELFTTVSGCDSVVTLFLNVDAVIDTTITVDICEGDTYVLGIQTLSTSGIFTELFTTAGGCDSIVTLELQVLDCEALLQISNVCTPNGDGKNDTWLVSDLNQIVGCSVGIYNRWGQPVYQTDNYQNEWDGTKEGEVLPDGVYYYTIECDGDRQYEGAINLMRFKQ